MLSEVKLLLLLNCSPSILDIFDTIVTIVVFLISFQIVHC